MTIIWYRHFSAGACLVLAACAFLPSVSCRREPREASGSQSYRQDGPASRRPAGTPAPRGPSYGSPAAAVSAVRSSAGYQAVPDKKSLHDLAAVPAFTALMASPGFQTVAASRHFAALVENSAFQSLLDDRTFAGIANDQAAAAAISRGTAAQVVPALASIAPNAPLPRQFSNSAEAYYLYTLSPFVYLAARPYFSVMVANPDFRALMSEPGFGWAVANAQWAFTAMLHDPRFRRLASSGELAKLAASPAFGYLAEQKALDQLVSAPDSGKR
jgi:hypothetical protein